MAVKSYEEYLKEIQKNNQAELDEASSTIKNNYATQKEQVNKNYETQINNIDEDYAAEIDRNEVQRLINEREVAESMANLGLTDSGLNRTQQTAVQLSAANQASKLNLQRQKTLDSMAASLADAISQLDIAEASELQTAKSNWNQRNEASAVEMYNNDVKSAAEVQTAYYSALENQQKQQEQESYIIKVDDFNLRGDYEGTLKSNNVSVRYYTDSNGNEKTKYIDGNSGKTTIVDRTVNPYTGQDNADIIAEFGAYDNGYQPKGKKGVGKFVGTAGTDVKYGNRQNIFKTADGRLWIWDRNLNDYQQYVR